jgi:hypothetical protein
MVVVGLHGMQHCSTLRKGALSNKSGTMMLPAAALLLLLLWWAVLLAC